MNIYETCPTLESEKFAIRLFQNGDCDDLLKVYSDKNALPFFNSDNCDGDNFYYATKEEWQRRSVSGIWHTKTVGSSDFLLSTRKYQVQ